ncbi:MAG: hypothetical protein LBC94_04905 [Desulfovibrio sp.]|jgi:hypothetical protein|nr:hypothetical protein [Desulfovibrio sp.]
MRFSGKNSRAPARITIFCLAAFLLCALLPGKEAFAAAVPGMGLPTIGVGIAGYSHTTPAGPIASTQNVAQAAMYTVECINSQIKESTREIVTALAGQNEANKAIAKANIDALKEMLEQIEIARTTSQLQRKVDTVAQASNSCDARDGAAAFGVGRKAEGDTRQAYNQWQAEQGDGKADSVHSQSEKNTVLAATMNNQDPLGDWMFPKDGLIRSEEERNKALELARESINPRPTPEPDEKDDNVSVKEAKYAIQVKKSRLAVAQDTNSAIIASHMGLLDAGAVVESMSKSMGGGAGEQIPQDANGRVSIMTYLDVWSKSRFGNPNWFMELFGAVDEMRLMREAVFMQALQVEIQRRQLEYEMRNAQMLSTMLGILTEQNENGHIYRGLSPSRSSGQTDSK